jgi:hypothetical protein
MMETTPAAKSSKTNHHAPCLLLLLLVLVVSMLVQDDESGAAGAGVDGCPILPALCSCGGPGEKACMTDAQRAEYNLARLREPFLGRRRRSSWGWTSRFVLLFA